MLINLVCLVDFLGLEEGEKKTHNMHRDKPPKITNPYPAEIPRLSLYFLYHSIPHRRSFPSGFHHPGLIPIVRAFKVFSMLML